MTGVPGTSEAARTSSDNSLSTLRNVKVPATAGVRSHWAAAAVQSVDSSLKKAGCANTVVAAPCAKQPVSPWRMKRPADGSSQLIDATLPVPDIPEAVVSSWTTASMGVVPQLSAYSTQITLPDEVSSRIGFWPNRRPKRWPRAANVMSFASLARVATVVLSSFTAALAQHGAPDAQALHAAIVRGEAGWQRRAFDAFHGLVHGLLIKSLGPRAEIADLLGDVFVTFFASAQRIRNEHAVRSYLVSITMNVARREIRQRKRRELFQRFAGSVSEYEREAGSDDPKATAALLQLSRILDELSADERAAFVLSSLEGMPAAEVAELLGVSESTAKRRIRRASEHLLKRVSRSALLCDYVQARTGRAHG
jgi:RNA polymerase sigma-70 factor, ECF subfamily